ncbi:hypothetical protein AX14_004003, partial [Amanita brunnescens Koide BX004]
MSSNQDLWKELLPLLIGPYLNFLKNTTGKSGVPILGEMEQYNCRTLSCQAMDVDILCFTFDGIQNYTITSCRCQKLEEVMVGRGLFPASPDLPRVAFHISLLDLFQTLLDEMNAPVPLAVIVEKYYMGKGFTVLDHNGTGIFDKFEIALQWYHSLQSLLNVEVDQTLTICEG